MGRALCLRCRQAKAVCDCELFQPFDSKLEFVILIHPEEVRKRVATGRLSHLLLKNSHLIEGESFDENESVQKLLQDPSANCLILYPALNSLNLTLERTRPTLPTNKRQVIFVIDGTWRTAKKMLRLSPSLASIPKVSFESPGLSRFEIRKQPAAECLSTLEAIHHVIELIGDQHGFPVASRQHDHLLEMFDRMVDRQIDYQNRLGSRKRERLVKRTPHELGD